jgi:iron complex outermembrane receptor protein
MRSRRVQLILANYRPGALPSVARRVGAMLLVLVGSFLRAGESRGLSRKFDLPADAAEISLNRFGDQSGRGVVFATERVKGVKTNAVKGEWTPAEALEQMLAGTRLVFTRDAKTGAFAVGLQPAAPPAPRERPAPVRRSASDNSRPPPNSAAIASAVPDEPLEMSPFSVNTDHDNGYAAENSLAGTRLNEPLRDTASSVSVFTREFLDDAAITDVSELIRYSVNSDPHTDYTGATVGQAQNGSRIVPNIYTRGQVISHGLDFFISITPTDPYRAARYEDSRGPNSILFGVGRPGGVLNQTSKVANVARDHRAIRYSLGSWGRHRLELEANHVLRPGALAVLLAAVRQENEGWRAFDFQDKKRVYGAVTFRPSRTLRFTAMGETGRDVTALTPVTAENDAVLAWYDNRQAFGADAVTFASNTPLSNTQALGVTGRDGRRGGNNHRVTFIENSGAIFDTIGTLLTGSYNNAAVRSPDGSAGGSATWLRLNDPAFYPRNLNAAGPGAFGDQRLKNYTITAEWQPTRNLAFNLSHNYQNSAATVHHLNEDNLDNPALRGEANRTLGFDGPLNPWAGRLYVDGNWRRRVRRADIRETRLSTSFFLEPRSPWLGQHRLGTLLSQSTQFDAITSSVLVLAGRPFDPLPTGVNNRITVRSYLTEGNYFTYRVGDWRSLPPTVTLEGKSYPLVFANESGSPLHGGGLQDLRSALAVLQSRFAGGKLVTTFGYRRDRVASVSLGYDDDPILGAVVNPDRDRGTSVSTTARTGTAGVVYHVSDWLSLLANRSSNHGARELLSIRTFPDDVPTQNRGRGEDYGFGFNLLGGRLNAKVVRFKLSGNAGNPGETTVSPAALNLRVMDAFAGVLVGNNRPYSAMEWESLYRTYAHATGGPTIEFDAAGYEAQLTANVTPQWRLVANYSYTPNSGQRNFGRSIIAWYGLKTDSSGRLLPGVAQDASGRFVVNPGAFQRGGTVAKWIELGAKAPAADPAVLVTASGQTVAQEILSLVDSLNEKEEEFAGKRLLGLRPHKIGVFTAYDFKEGWLRGFTLGGGWRWRSPDIIGRNSQGNEVTGRVLTSADLMLAYQWEFNRLPGRVRVQVNVLNLFNHTPIMPVRYSTSDRAPHGFVVPGGRGVAYGRYDLTPPREIRCTTTYSF